MAQKPSIPKGTRDFSPLEVQKRNYIIETLKRAFELFGFQPIETPSFENLETLTGKYGDEGDQLIFRVLRSGDFAKKANDADWAQKNASALAGQISDKAMRYDLTVPFARYVVQHQNELAFPFKRYQIQPVWRADRPQKGRFREFYQCDADVVGSKSLWQEVEFIQLYDLAFSNMKLPVTLRINNRKILAGIVEALGIGDKLISFTVSLDKLDKIGIEGVLKEMAENGIPKTAIEQLKPLLQTQESSTNTLDMLSSLLKDSVIGKEGLAELSFVLNETEKLGLVNTILFDLTLARGLNYYTGAIFEVSANGVEIGSIGGGGRYDDLTSIFGLKNMSGIGISFGLDRIFLCLEELQLFPQDALPAVKALFLNFGEAESAAAMRLIMELRREGISAELYPDNAKMKKQFDFAGRKEVAHLVFLGAQELDQQVVKVKSQATGEQDSVPFNQLAAYLKN